MATRFLLALALSLAGAPVLAQSPALPAWENLTAQQREALIAPVRDRWNDAPPPQRERMLAHGQRWLSMTPEQRELAQRGRHRFENMTPEQREQARALFGQMRTMRPEERKALRDQWARMTPEQRQEWLKANPVKDPPPPPPKR